MRHERGHKCPRQRIGEIKQSPRARFPSSPDAVECRRRGTQLFEVSSDSAKDVVVDDIPEENGERSLNAVAMRRRSTVTSPPTLRRSPTISKLGEPLEQLHRKTSTTGKSFTQDRDASHRVAGVVTRLIKGLVPPNQRRAMRVDGLRHSTYRGSAEVSARTASWRDRTLRRA